MYSSSAVSIIINSNGSGSRDRKITMMILLNIAPITARSYNTTDTPARNHISAPVTGRLLYKPNNLLVNCSLCA